MPLSKITRKLGGTFVTFHGYDGRDYLALVVRVARGVATINYKARAGIVTAYIDNPARLERRE